MPKRKNPEAQRAGNNLLEEPMPKAPFTKVGDSSNTDVPRSTHPLHQNMSRVSQALEKMGGKEALEEKLIEDLENWKKVVVAIAGTKNGQAFLKVMNRHARLFQPADTGNTTQVVLDAAKQAFYLKHVRPYLDATHKGEVE